MGLDHRYERFVFVYVEIYVSVSAFWGKRESEWYFPLKGNLKYVNFLQICEDLQDKKEKLSMLSSPEISPSSRLKEGNEDKAKSNKKDLEHHTRTQLVFLGKTAGLDEEMYSQKITAKGSGVVTSDSSLDTSGSGVVTSGSGLDLNKDKREMKKKDNDEGQSLSDTFAGKLIRVISKTVKRISYGKDLSFSSGKDLDLLRMKGMRQVSLREKQHRSTICPLILYDKLGGKAKEENLWDSANGPKYSAKKRFRAFLLSKGSVFHRIFDPNNFNPFIAFDSAHCALYYKVYNEIPATDIVLENYSLN